MLIFRVPYHPSVVPETEPYDMQIFYSNSGQLGGLEFNNVRYNISELNAKGMSLDSNGATNSTISGSDGSSVSIFRRHACVTLICLRNIRGIQLTASWSKPDSQ